MAKKKEVSLRDLLVKLDKYFKDVYILHGTCFCGGTVSEASTRGFYFGIFAEESIGTIKNLYEEGHRNLHIPLIKDCKDDLSKIKEINDSDIHKYEDKFDNLYTKAINTIEWRAVPLTDAIVEKLLTTPEVVTLPFVLNDGTEIPLECSKSLFPGITKAHIYELQYGLSQSDDFYHLIVRYHLDTFFTIFMYYTFLK